MTKPELGSRHQCKRCGARFFDLNKSPITCPKCGTIVHAAPLSRVAHRVAVTDSEDSPAGAREVMSGRTANEASAHHRDVIVFAHTAAGQSKFNGSAPQNVTG